MHDQIFWSGDHHEVFSPVQRVTSAILSTLVLVGVVVGLVAVSGFAVA